MTAARLLVAVALTGCPAASTTTDDPTTDDGTTDIVTTDGPTSDTGTEPVAVLARASKSSSIAITDDDAWVVMVVPGNDSIAVFRADDNTRTATVPTGDEPSAVVLHPDGVTAFVANRAAATVVRVDGIDKGSPLVGAPVPVGSEPTGLALSPTGAVLFVAEWAEGRVSVIDTATMEIVGEIDAPVSPRGLAVTNDGDTDDADELLVVPEFFGEPVAEMSDEGRIGRIRTFAVSDYSDQGTIELSPFDSGFGVSTAPNQLYAVAVAGDRVFVPSVSASPEPPVDFNQNVQPVVYVATLSTLTEDRTAIGTQNLARFVRDDIPAGEPRFFLADLVDFSIVGEDIGYALSRGTNVIQRIEYNEALGVQIGSEFNLQIEIGAAPAGAPEGCLVPQGIVTSLESKRAYVDCFGNRRMGVVDLTIQEQVTTVEAAPPLSDAADIEVARGLRFFHTGRARWSQDGWSSCASCHPDGLSDGITWSFGAGPRQTIALDGSFTKGDGPQGQRVFNWTGIFDEIHDFERNTRNVSGGLGAVTQSEDCGNLAAEVPSALDGGLGIPVKEVQDTQPDNCTDDWDAIEAWVRTVRPPKASQTADPDAVSRGQAEFVEGGCDRCHSGGAFTVSRLFYTPSSETNAALTETAFPPTELPIGFPDSWNRHSVDIAVEPVTGFGPPQVACGIRSIGTFGVPGDESATEALEVRPDGKPSQGSQGFNVPSLYGMSLGAPYLHHGQAETLTVLFTDARWRDHLRSGNAVYTPTDDEVADLVAFVRSIDETTPELPTPPGYDLCLPREP